MRKTGQVQFMVKRLDLTSIQYFWSFR